MPPPLLTREWLMTSQTRFFWARSILQHFEPQTLTLSYLLRQASMSNLPSLIYLGSDSKQLLTEVIRFLFEEFCQNETIFEILAAPQIRNLSKKKKKKTFLRRKWKKLFLVGVGVWCNNFRLDRDREEFYLEAPEVRNVLKGSRQVPTKHLVFQRNLK